jgi:hypothetical protein
MSYTPHTGAAERLKHGGGERQNSPFRQLEEGGHALNHGYKNPVAAVMGGSGTNASYMHPLDHGAGAVSENSPKPFALGKQIKPMSQQGPGKSGPVQLR